jgi:hypothetical protein
MKKKKISAAAFHYFFKKPCWLPILQAADVASRASDAAGEQAPLL